MAPLGLTFGRMVDGAAAGKHAAEYRKISGTALATYNVPHGLGFVPAWAILVHYVNPGNPATHMNMAPFEYDKWTASEIRVRFFSITGAAVAGTEFWIMIGGER